MENILLNVQVKMDGFNSNLKSAIDETYEFSKKMNIGCILNYANQYKITILPSMSQEEIETIKNIQRIIGL